MLNLNSLIINTKNQEELIKFYTEVFEKPVNEMQGWVVGNTFFGILEHSEVNEKVNGVPHSMFNLETDDVKGEFERISKIDGIQVIKEPYQMGEWDGWIATLADPDGNFFQLISPWDETSTSN